MADEENKKSSRWISIHFAICIFGPGLTAVIGQQAIKSAPLHVALAVMTPLLLAGLGSSVYVMVYLWRSWRQRTVD